MKLPGFVAELALPSKDKSKLQSPYSQSKIIIPDSENLIISARGKRCTGWFGAKRKCCDDSGCWIEYIALANVNGDW